MRELALVTLRIVDETIQLQPEDVRSLYTPDYTNPVAADNMVKLERPTGAVVLDGAVHETSDGGHTYQPKAQMSVVRIEPCNFDSALGALILEDERTFVSQFVTKLGNAGMKLLDHENDDRSRIHDMSKTLGGDGVDPVDMIQFYAVFSVFINRDVDTVGCYLEGVLRLDKIDMAIDEAILL